MWIEVSLGRGSGAARGRALPALAWMDHNSSTSPRTPRHRILHPRCIVAMRCVRFSCFRGLETSYNVIALDPHNFSDLRPNRARFFLLDAEHHRLHCARRIYKI